MSRWERGARLSGNENERPRRLERRGERSLPATAIPGE
jgi:hypothetical protein